MLTDQLFPMGMKDLMHHLEDIVERWYQLGVQLDVPISKLREIRCNNSSDVYQCRLLMLQEWQRRPTLKPSWCTLVDALRNMKENAVAESISQHFSKLDSARFYSYTLQPGHVSRHASFLPRISSVWPLPITLLFDGCVHIHSCRCLPPKKAARPQSC